MVTNYTYDKAGNVIETDQIVNGVTRKTTSTYNALGLVTSTTDPLGYMTVYQYNSDGELMKTVYADSSSVTDRYDSNGRKVAEIDQNGLERTTSTIGTAI